MKRLGFVAALMALAAPEVATAQRACITAPEAEAMTLVAMPDILRETGRVCGARLPATSLIRGNGTLLSKYESAADQAWPAARAAIVKLSDPAIDTLLQSDYARPLLTSLLVPFIVGRIGLEDCGTIDRLVTQLAPLPPRNMAGVVVTALQYLKTEKARGRQVAVPDLPLCTNGN
ncbi:hypothetical protein [uncultured Sphingomonas sp.]|uniref:hypothetical protein n=1 Tax=uncultured Sphingomonas sp. TaxID=158754 RepID=UPI0025E73D86|nr:hypothetical protein [uncultured Sphingomonas sp.]